MDIKFYLKNSKKSETPIFALCHFGYKNYLGKYIPVKLYTGLKIDPDYWSKNRNRAKETKEFPEFPEFNQTINEFESKVKKLFYRLQNEGKNITPELFKQEWDKQEYPTPEPEKTDLLEFADKYPELIKPIRAKGTIKNHRNSIKHIKEFSTHTGIPLKFENINIDLGLQLVEYLKTTKQFAPNTIWRIIKVLRLLMNEAAERKLHSNFEYKSKSFGKLAPPEETDTIYLNNTELEKIYSVKLNSEKLERVRDLFLIGCYTGLRFGNFNKLTTDSIIEFEGEKIFHIISDKRTNSKDTYLDIPIHHVVYEIIEKYGGKIPKGMSNQKFNEYIKDVGKLAEINELVTITKTVGNLNTETQTKKYKLVSTHTARRSFATNTYLAGIPAKSIMKITGHKTEKAFMTYLRLSNKEHAREMAKHEFFRKPQLKIAN